MGNDTVYNVEWQEKYDFLRPGPNEYKAKCEDCNKVFSIKKVGGLQILSSIVEE